MTSLQAVVFYGGFHLLMLAFVSYNVSRFRLKHKVNLGDGGNDEVLRAIRAQGNYVEYAAYSYPSNIHICSVSDLLLEIEPDRMLDLD